MVAHGKAGVWSSMSGFNQAPGVSSRSLSLAPLWAAGYIAFTYNAFLMVLRGKMRSELIASALTRFANGPCAYNAQSLANKALIARDQPPGSPVLYGSQEEIVLRFGLEFVDFKPCPETFCSHAGLCFRNSYLMSTNDIVYVEGFALNCGIVSTQHAWLYDLTDSLAIDATWLDAAHLVNPEYIGIPLRNEIVRDAMSGTGEVLYNFTDMERFIMCLHVNEWLHPAFELCADSVVRRKKDGQK